MNFKTLVKSKMFPNNYKKLSGTIFIFNSVLKCTIQPLYDNTEIST